MTVVAARAPAGLGGTAQGLFSASAGLATILGSLGGGAVAGALGIRGLFADLRRRSGCSGRACSRWRCCVPDPIRRRPAGDRRRGMT